MIKKSKDYWFHSLEDLEDLKYINPKFFGLTNIVFSLDIFNKSNIILDKLLDYGLEPKAIGLSSYGGISIHFGNYFNTNHGIIDILNDGKIKVRFHNLTGKSIIIEWSNIENYKIYFDYLSDFIASGDYNAGR
jgi:hypothetical protein